MGFRFSLPNGGTTKFRGNGGVGHGAEVMDQCMSILSQRMPVEIYIWDLVVVVGLAVLVVSTLAVFGCNCAHLV